jgi:hypothetical protein
LWREGEPKKYRNKLINTTYHVISHHIYELQENGVAKVTKTYWRISGRGNPHEITREEAIEIIYARKGYIDDYDSMNLGPDTSPNIPYNASCDW